MIFGWIFQSLNFVISNDATSGRCFGVVSTLSAYWRSLEETSELVISSDFKAGYGLCFSSALSAI